MQIFDNFFVKGINIGGSSTSYNCFQKGTDDKLEFRIIIIGTFYSVSATNTNNDGEWHHCVCTKSTAVNRNGMKIYIDGVLDATGTALAITGSVLNNDAMTLGAGSVGGNPLTGNMKDWKFWDVELVLADVQQLFRTGLQRWGVGGAIDGDDL